MDQRCNLHSKQLATQGGIEKVRAELKVDIADAKTGITEWNIGAIIAAAGLFAAITKTMGAARN
jgi:hypothetical protein